VSCYVHLLVKGLRNLHAVSIGVIQERQSVRGVALHLKALRLSLGFLTTFFHASVAANSQNDLGVRKQKYAPPLNAEFLFYLFMTPQDCDALVGDLEERYKLIHKRFGRRRANFWYWTQAVTSVGPIVWAWAKKGSRPESVIEDEGF
jgi:hypothetical protein